MILLQESNDLVLNANCLRPDKLPKSDGKSPSKPESQFVPEVEEP